MCINTEMMCFNLLIFKYLYKFWNYKMLSFLGGGRKSFFNFNLNNHDTIFFLI
jgi:hypothetical protein